jgi:putative FmdB family regulatory protein
MPTYEYECPRCAHRFERFQGINDKPLKTCPECKGRKVKRLIGTGAGIIFKGSGFYETDYRSDSYKKGAKQETEAKSSGEKKPEKKSGKEPKAKPKTDKKKKEK